MPLIRIETGRSTNVTGQLLGHGTKLFIDDKQVQDVTDITLHFDHDRVVRCDVGLQLRDRFEFVGNVDLYLQLHLNEGDTLEQSSEGKYTVVRKS